MIDYSKEPGKKLQNKYLMVDEKPLVTIITPFYNASKHFEQTFNSVLNQTFPWYEWIIVDDGSRKEEAEYIDTYAKLDNRIKVLHKENGGPSSARNVAIKMATTEYIMPLDADDLIEPQHLECLYWALVTNPEGAWAYSGLVGFGVKHHLWKYVFTSEHEKYENICIVNGLIRKSVLEDVGGYLELARLYNEDWHLYLRMLAKGYRPVQIEQYSFWYRTNDTGVDTTVARNPEIMNNNLRLISEVRETVPDGIRSIRFNGYGYTEFENVKKWDWDRKLHYKDERQRILLLLPHMVVGGADKFNYDLLRMIDRDRYTIGIITTVNDDNVWKQKFAEYVDDIFELPQFLNLRDWPAFFHYYIYTRNVSLVLNISSFYSYYILPWIRMEFPDVGIIDYIHADCKYWRLGGYTRISSYMDNTLERTIVANRATLDIMVNDYGKDKNKCILSYIGTDENYFNPEKVQYGKIRHEFKIESTRSMVLFLCRLSHEKRCYLVVEIAKKLRELMPDVAFMVVGDGECKGEMERRVRDNSLEETIYFAGNQENVREYYRDADVLLICSIKEGLALTTFEGMAMELPVVSSNVGSQGEIVNAETGALIDCLQDELLDFARDNYSEIEIKEYVDALYKILSDKEKAKTIGRKNRKLIEEQYSFNSAVKLIEQIVEECKSEALLEKRRKQSELFRTYHKEIEEFLTIYLAFEQKCVEAGEIWVERCRLVNELEVRQREKDDLVHNYEQEMQRLRDELQSIKTLRLYPLVEGYCRFVGENAVGKRIYALLKKFFGKK